MVYKEIVYKAAYDAINTARLQLSQRGEKSLFFELMRDAIAEKFARDIIQQRVLTNADAVRGMSDEEIAEILVKYDFCSVCEHEKDKGLCDVAGQTDKPLWDFCKVAAVKWLGMKVEGENDE